MPGHFTHIYTARRVADLLMAPETTSFDQAGSDLKFVVGNKTPHAVGKIMTDWEKFTAIGAVGPDLFFFLQDFSNSVPGHPFFDDELMLALAAYFWSDSAKEHDYEPLVQLLAEVNSTFAEILRVLIIFKNIIEKFVAAWNATIGPVVEAGYELVDDLTGGTLDEFYEALKQLGRGLGALAEEQLLTSMDLFEFFSLKMRQGWDEQSFLWSDMLHYRHTSEMAQNLLAEAERQRQEEGLGDQQYEQFLAYIFGYCCHLGTDTVAHAFVNEQCGGPFRTHYQRHHLIENHIDASNYRQATTHPDPRDRSQGLAGGLPADVIAATPDYPDVDGSYLHFAVAVDSANPQGWPRPDPLPKDPDERRIALDKDGELPDWLCRGIVRAMIATYQHDGEPQPANLGGSAFQARIPSVVLGLGQQLDGANVRYQGALHDLVEQIAPDPGFEVPFGYPLPWEVGASYKLMIAYYKLSFGRPFDLHKPPTPQFLVMPPASHITDIASAPDLHGISSDHPLRDFCSDVKSFLKWLGEEIVRVGRVIGDFIKLALSPISYLPRKLLYEAAMSGWYISSYAHELLAHAGFVYPHGERIENGEVAVLNEIDEAIITLGQSTDSYFAVALLEASDIYGDLDSGMRDVLAFAGIRGQIDADLTHVDDPHDPLGPYPYLPVRERQDSLHKTTEFRRPWAYPAWARGEDLKFYPTPIELWNPQVDLERLGRGDVALNMVKFMGIRYGWTTAGPYLFGTKAHQIFDGNWGPGEPELRTAYESAQSPADTDYLSYTNIIGARTLGQPQANPLGNPVPFSAYLIGRILGPEKYHVNFNLDADRGYGYRCWDWDRFHVDWPIGASETGLNGRGTPYPLPDVAPEGAPYNSDPRGGPAIWDGALPETGQRPLQLHYLGLASSAVKPRPYEPPADKMNAFPTKLGQTPPPTTDPSPGIR